MLKQVIRKAGNNLVCLDFLYGTGGNKDFYTARAYELTDTKSTHTGRFYHENQVWGDIGQNVAPKQEKEAYRLIDLLFPELINVGLKAEGYVKYAFQDVPTSLFT